MRLAGARSGLNARQSDLTGGQESVSTGLCGEYGQALVRTSTAGRRSGGRLACGSRRVRPALCAPISRRCHEDKFHFRMMRSDENASCGSRHD